MTYLLFSIGMILFLYGSFRIRADLRLRKLEPVHISVKDFGVKEEKIAQMYVNVSYYFPWVTYEYVSGGRKYSKEKEVLSNLKCTDESQAEQRIRDLIKKERAYIDQQNPDKAILEIPSNAEIMNRRGGILLGGVVLAFIATAIFWLN